jgi:L-aminopeptidase/D-esterase-like protein
MRLRGAITDVPGILVGHAQDDEALTGCTAILCLKGAVGGVDQRGGAPGTRETDALRPMHLVGRIHGVMLAGGSAFGLDSASGAMRFLEEKKIGFRVGAARVPIVAAAILLDLNIGSATRRPDADMGYRACRSAAADPPAEGNAGAGAGCTVGKILGFGRAMKSGIGTASRDCGGGVVVGAIAAVNALGDVVDPASGAIIAGARSLKFGPLRLGEKGPFAGTLSVLRSLTGRSVLRIARGGNTVIGVVATNARLNREEANKMAQMAQDGLARAVQPAHTMLDGDTIFSLATGDCPADVNIAGAFAAEAFAEAVVRAVRSAKTAGGLPGLAG